MAKEKSPYLLQHAGNPVDWYAWGEEAFGKAKEEDKPIFLSIGYSTCHWCHVMARESFESEETAKILNDHFVSIKVDREERPDVDQIYMAACQVMTAQGGWPLSIWMTPDRKPFYAGTYFPPEDRRGQPGFPSLLAAIAKAWKESRERLLEDAEQLVTAVQESAGARPGEPTKETLSDALQGYKDSFDETYGGFGRKPKFPRGVNLEFLLRMHRRTNDAKALAMAEETLHAMRRGGMYDQLGGGFHRYSTDERWLVPHFEKMLYDNALLVRAYVAAFQATGNEEYAGVARETLAYVLRDMTSPEGAFYSAEDADSDLPTGGHAEGAFYVWKPEEILEVVPGEAGRILCRAFGVVEGGNFTPAEKEEPRGNSVLHVAADVDILSDEFKKPAKEIRTILADGASALFAARSKRPRPHLDDKVLTDWNALAIGALAVAGSALEEPRYLEAAGRAARFLLDTLRLPDGRWLHRYRAGEAGIPAFLDDYAYLAEGFFLLHQATFRLEYLEVAVRTADRMIEDFADPEGGFYHTPPSTRLIARLMETYDGALPSGNATATLTLVRLGDLCGRNDSLKRADLTLKRFGGTIRQYPPGYPYHLCALDALLGPRREIVVAGRPEAPETREMLRAVRRRYLPNTVVVLVPPEGPDEAMRGLIPMSADRPARDGKTTAYVCENYACRAPIVDVAELGSQI